MENQTQKIRIKKSFFVMNIKHELIDVSSFHFHWFESISKSSSCSFSDFFSLKFIYVSVIKCSKLKKYEFCIRIDKNFRKLF